MTFNVCIYVQRCPGAGLLTVTLERKAGRFLSVCVCVPCITPLIKEYPTTFCERYKYSIVT